MLNMQGRTAAAWVQTQDFFAVRRQCSTLSANPAIPRVNKTINKDKANIEKYWSLEPYMHIAVSKSLKPPFISSSFQSF